jgi:hypothetical protein
MLKKSLLAITVAAAAVGSVQAQQIARTANLINPPTSGDPGGIRISSEGLTALGNSNTIAVTGVTAVAGSPGVVSAGYEINAAIASGDVITFTLIGARLTSGSTPNLGNANLPLLSAVNSPDAEAPSAEITFRATGTVTASIASPVVLPLNGITLEDVVNPGVVTLAAQTQISNGSNVFNVAATRAIADVRSQFVLGDAVPPGERQFNSVIDVEFMRQQFVAASDAGAVTNGSNRAPESITRDDFFVSINSAQTLLNNVTVTSAQIELALQDSDFLLNEGTATTAPALDPARFDITALNGAVTDGTGNDAPSLVNNVLTVATGNDPGGYVGIALLPEGAAGTNPAQLNAQSFSADLEVRYVLSGTTGNVSREDINAGAWTLSGATVNIPFMPFGPNFAQVIRLSNDGSVAGEIELTAFDNEGDSFGPVILDVAAAAGTVTNIVPAVTAALAAEGFDGSGDLDLTFIINSPADDIEVEANYRVLTANDRVGVTVINP